MKYSNKIVGNLCFFFFGKFHKNAIKKKEEYFITYSLFLKEKIAKFRKKQKFELFLPNFYTEVAFFCSHVCHASSVVR
jgi:hypothetical protein